MPITPELLIAILSFAEKFGLDAALAVATATKGGTIDDLISALRTVKPLQQIIDEDKASSGVV